MSRKTPDTIGRFREQNPRFVEIAGQVSDDPVVLVGERLSDLDMDKSNLRALRAMAEHICVTRLTDGFCRSENKPECKCWTDAGGLLRSLDSVGVQCVWLYEADPKPTAKGKGGK